MSNKPDPKRQLSIWLPPEYIEKLKKLAAADRRPPSNLVRLIVMDYVDEKEGQS